MAKRQKIEHSVVLKGANEKLEDEFNEMVDYEVDDLEPRNSSVISNLNDKLPTEPTLQPNTVGTPVSEQVPKSNSTLSVEPNTVGTPVSEQVPKSNSTLSVEKSKSKENEVPTGDSSSFDLGLEDEDLMATLLEESKVADGFLSKIGDFGENLSEELETIPAILNKITGKFTLQSLC